MNERNCRENYKIALQQHLEAKTAFQDWAEKVKEANWTCFANIKQSFNSVDFVGNQHYVFNIKGNDFRLIAVVKFTPQFVLIRFIGTHAEYDRIRYISNI